MGILFSQALEITTPWLMAGITILGLLATFGSYFVRIEYQTRIQNASNELKNELIQIMGERFKEVARRIDAVEQNNSSTREEVSSMRTQQMFMSSNIEKLEINTEKMDTKLDNLVSQHSEQKVIMQQILEKLKNLK